MKSKKLLAVLAASAMVLAGCGSSSSSSSSASSSSDLSTKKVGVIQYAQHDALDASYEGFKDALVAAGVSEDNINVQNASGEQSNCETIADTLIADGCDLIYAIATPAAQAVANKTKDIPIVVCAVTDPESAELVESNDAPGTNVTGASDLTPVAEQMELLTQLLPDAKTVAVMYAGSEANSEYQAKIAFEEAEKLGLETLDKTVSDSNDIKAVADSIAGKADVVYVPTDNLIAANMETLAQSMDEAGIPIICGEEGMVTNGGTATYGINYTNLGKMAGEMAVKILNGEGEPSTMAIEYLSADECVLNISKSKVEKFNITVPDDLDAKATYSD